MIEPWIEKQSFSSEIDSLVSATSFVIDSINSHGAPNSMLSQIELILEEVFVNISVHAYKGKPGQVDLSCGIMKDGDFFLEFVDFGPEFNPLKKSEPKINLPIEQREIGGLGIHLVKKLAKTMEYFRNTSSNRLLIRLDFPKE